MVSGMHGLWSLVLLEDVRWNQKLELYYHQIVILAIVAMVVMVVPCTIISILVIIGAICVLLGYCRAQKNQQREKGCQGANLNYIWWWRGSLVSLLYS